MPEPICDNPASVIRRSVLSRTGTDRPDRSFGVTQQYVPPSQYLGSFVLGVLPPTTHARSPIQLITHPFGISPNSESSNDSGNKSASDFGRPRPRPSTLARTGSKS